MLSNDTICLTILIEREFHANINRIRLNKQTSLDCFHIKYSETVYIYDELWFDSVFKQPEIYM